MTVPALAWVLPLCAVVCVAWGAMWRKVWDAVVTGPFDRWCQHRLNQDGER